MVRKDGRPRPALHPDAEPVYSSTWSVMSPTRHGERFRLALEAKRPSVDPLLAPDSETDRLARALLVNPRFDLSFRTMFNGITVVWYSGEALTELAERRG